MPNPQKSPLNLITTSRQVTWKRLDLCIEACKKTGDNLTLIGDGPEHKRLVKLAKNCSNIHFLPTMSQAKLANHLNSSDAYLFPSLEPFGIAPVEALAAGCPVIAYGAGGALDYVCPGENGLLFDSQSANSLAAAIENFRKTAGCKTNRSKVSCKTAEKFDPKKISASAIPYDVENFKIAIKRAVAEALK